MQAFLDCCRKTVAAVAKQTWYQPFLSSKDQSSWDPGRTKVAGAAVDAAAPEAVAVAAVATTGTAGIVAAAEVVAAAAVEVVADVAAAAADVAAAVAAASKPAAYPKCCPWVQACIVALWVLVMLVVALLSQRFPN